MNSACNRCKGYFPTSSLVFVQMYQASVCVICFQALNKGNYGQQPNPPYQQPFYSPPPPPPPLPPPQGRAPNKINVTHTSKEINEQNQYLDYVSLNLLQNYNDSYTSLDQTWKTIENNFNIIITKLSEVKLNCFNEINRIDIKNKELYREIQSQIENFKKQRIETLSIMQKIFTGYVPTNEEMSAFSRFEYPKFQFKFCIMEINFNLDKVPNRVIKILGWQKMVYLKAQNEFSNNNTYKKYKEDMQLGVARPR